ncbi:MAG: class I SAM-dependent methyltransferase [Nanoarchaeota archaeon]
MKTSQPLPQRLPELDGAIFDNSYAEAAKETAHMLAPKYAEMAKAVRDLNLHEPTSLIEAGCGIGNFTWHIAKELPKTRIIGEDIDTQVIQYAQDNNNHLPNLSFQLGDISSISQRHRDVGCILVKDMLHHLPNLKGALVQVYNSLKPQGSFLGYDLDRSRFYNEFYKNNPRIKILTDLVRKVRKNKSESEARTYLESLNVTACALMSFMAAYTREEVTNALKETGFRVLSMREDELHGFRFFAIKPKTSSSRLI